MQEAGPPCEITPQEHLVVIRDEKVSPFAELQVNLPLLCFLLDSFTGKNDAVTLIYLTVLHDMVLQNS